MKLNIVASAIIVIVMFLLLQMVSSIFYGGFPKLIIVGIAILLVYKYGLVKSTEKEDKQKTYNNEIKIWAIVIISIVVMIAIFSKDLGYQAQNFFAFYDSFLHVSDFINPVIMWLVTGGLLGSIYGCYIAWKKYKLNFSVFYKPVGVFVAFIGVISILNLSSGTASNQPFHEEAYNFVKVSTSSHLPDFEGTNYDSKSMIDKNDSTAWIGKKGTGDRISFVFSKNSLATLKNVVFLGFRLKNGYHKSSSLWNDHSRLQNFILYHNDKKIQEVQLPDSSDWIDAKTDYCYLNPGDSIIVELGSYYSGKRMLPIIPISELIPIVEYVRR